jgi:hypothetical protein
VSNPGRRDVLVVDDVQCNGPHAFGKATLIVACLAARGHRFEMVQTEAGFASLVTRFSDGKDHERIE